MDKVSVIIPSWNSADYIERTIDSVLSQTYSELEVVVADDASSDRTVDVISAIPDARIKLVARTDNGGAAAARNDAIDAASGRYVAFLDSDDRWRSDKLAVQIESMHERDVAFSYSSYYVCTEDRETVVKVPPVLDYRKLLRGNVVTTSTVIYDTKKLGKVFMPPLRMRQDYATWLNILKMTATGLGVEQPLTYYTKRTDSLSSKLLVATSYTYKVYRETQGIGVIPAAFYLSSHLAQAIRKRL